jgi:hypothetical protein
MRSGSTSTNLRPQTLNSLPKTDHYLRNPNYKNAQLRPCNRDRLKSWCRRLKENEAPSASARNPPLAAIIRSDQMQITFSIDLRDYIAGQTLHAKRSEMSFLGFCVGRYFYPFMGICILAFELTPHHSAGTPPSKTLSVACGLILCLIPVYIHFMTRRSFFRSRTSLGECTFDFSPELIRTSGPNSKSEVRWTAIQAFTEDDKDCLIYMAPARFLIVPKRVCTPAQTDELRALFARCINPAPLFD